MITLIFAGPSISAKTIHNHIDAVVLPPPSQGELYSAVEKYRPQVVGIIDTAFPRSAWTSEVFYVLRSGVATYGAAAQGALRAAELSDFGMHGVGVIYETYKSGEISADDAILCRYHQTAEGFTRLSEPLVNIKATLDAAYGAGKISEAVFHALADRATHLNWQERNWDTVLDSNIFKDDQELTRTSRFLLENQIDRQKEDALAMINAINADHSRNQDNRYKPASPFGMLEQMFSREEKVSRKQGPVPLFSVAHFAAANHPNPLEVNFNGMNRELVVFFAERMEIELTDEELQYERDLFKFERSLDDQGLSQWMSDNDVSEEYMAEMIRKNGLCRKFHQWLTMKKGLARSTKPFLDQLRLQGEYQHYADASSEVEATKEALPEAFHEVIKNSSLEELLVRKAKSRQLPWPFPLNQTARVLGITKEELIYELSREVFHQESVIAKLLETLYDEHH